MDKLLRANVALSIFCKNYTELKKGLPIRPSEMGVLNIITEMPGPHTPVMLAELLGVSKPMITAHITSLSQKGYIKKAQSLDDKRAYYVLPTEKALELVQQAKKDLNIQLERLISEMGESKFEVLVQLTQEAGKILEKAGTND